MIPHPARLAVITVHYGNPAVTAATVAKLWAGQRTPDQLIIIDHAEQPLVLSPHITQQIIRPATNAGYAGGLNIGLGILFAGNPSPRDIVVCMNNDAAVSPATLAALAAYFGGKTEPTLVGARWGKINPVTGRTSLLSPRLPREALAKWGDSSLLYIDGAFFAAPWALFLKVQKVPDDYWLYWEECVFNQRVRQLGFSRHVIPQLGVEHTDRDTGQQSRQHRYYLVRNGAHYMQTYTALPLRVWWRIYNRLRYVYHSLRLARSSSLSLGVEGRTGGSGQSKVVAAALRDALAGKLGKAVLPL